MLRVALHARNGKKKNQFAPNRSAASASACGPGTFGRRAGAAGGRVWLLQRGCLAVRLPRGASAGLEMEALATELGVLTPEQAAAPVNTVEVSGGLGQAAAGTRRPGGLWGGGDRGRARRQGAGVGRGEAEGAHLSAQSSPPARAAGHGPSAAPAQRPSARCGWRGAGVVPRGLSLISLNSACRAGPRSPACARPVFCRHEQRSFCPRFL